jgi:hypothetical protein
VLTAYDSCGGAELGCNDDASTTVCPTNGLNSRIQFLTTSGTTYYFRVADFGTAGGTLTLNLTYKFTLQMDQSAGPFSFVLANHAGTPAAVYITAVTLNQGAYPNGSFFGVEIPIYELIAEVTTPGGVPFLGVLDALGESSWVIPPFNVPPGIQLYAVTAQFNPLTGILISASPPTSLLTV